VESLIIQTGKQPTVSSLVISKQYGRRHDTVIRSIESLIESRHIGAHEFVVTSYTDKSNRQNKSIELIEDAFLIAMPFIGGKKAKDGQRVLVKAFSKYRRQAERRATMVWQQSRQQGKVARKDETFEIKLFIKYAKAQGSRHAGNYYQNLTKSTYKALFIVNGSMAGLREKLDPVQLAVLATAEYVANKALQEGMKKGMPYKDVFVLARDRMIELGHSIGPISLLEAEA
jgi:Rha family phage regulatory protein